MHSPWIRHPLCVLDWSSCSMIFDPTLWQIGRIGNANRLTELTLTHSNKLGKIKKITNWFLTYIKVSWPTYLDFYIYPFLCTNIYVLHIYPNVGIWYNFSKLHTHGYVHHASILTFRVNIIHYLYMSSILE
jgi:hypothetical protein